MILTNILKGGIFLPLFCAIFLSCQPTPISPHTKKGQSKIQIKYVHTPYHIKYLTIDGRVPVEVKWEGPVDRMIVEIEYIIRPTSPRRRFPIHFENLSGNYYTVYRDIYRINNTDTFEGNLTVFEKGDYRVKVTIINQYWIESRNSHFKVF